MVDDQTQPEPKTESSSVLNARVFTMPESYRHGKEAKLVVPEKQQKTVVAPTPLPPTPVKPLPTALKQPAKKQTHKALIISGVVVLLALSIGGYLLLRSVQQQQPVPQPPVVPVQPVPTPTTQEPEVVIPKQETETIPDIQNPFVVEVTSGKDSDSDGLTDLEENLLYKTNPNLPDTDSDGFLDGNEVFHRYNPNGTAPGTLLEAGVVQEVTISGLVLSFPVVWQFTNPSEGLNVFVSTTGEVIQLVVSDAGEEANLQAEVSAWITKQGGQEQIVKTLSKTGYELYLRQNKQQALLLVNGKILEFTYDLGTKATMDYAQTFQMILNSVELILGL